jgi:hypothetical protein
LTGSDGDPRRVETIGHRAIHRLLLPVEARGEIRKENFNARLKPLLII